MKNKGKNKISLLLVSILVSLINNASLAAMNMPNDTAPTVIDPPRGKIFKDPPIAANMSKKPGVVEVNLHAKIAPININGTIANLWTYNSSYPAPTIKVKHGDLLRVHYVNALTDTSENIQGVRRDRSNLHTHGLHVSPKGKADNVMLQFNKGGKFTYEYDLSLHPGGNLNFYHPHVHKASAEQLWNGMAGAIDVADETLALSKYETHIMMLKDISIANKAPSAYTMNDYMAGKEGNTVMVNGQVNPVLNIKPGQIQRWKIVNASNARFYNISLNKHTLQVIGTDGGLLDKPYAMSRILLAPGERLDILVKATMNTGYYKLISSPYQRDKDIMMSAPSNNQTVTLLTVNIKGKAINNNIPSSIKPTAKRITMPLGIPTRRITLDMSDMMNMMGMNSPMEAYINNIAFSDSKAYTIDSVKSSYEIWEIVNKNNMDHPFHQHTNAAQVLSISGGDPDYRSFLTKTPALKDTVIIPKKGTVRLLVPIKDYTGLAVFHCHILEHEDIGMMGLWDIR